MRLPVVTAFTLVLLAGCGPDPSAAPPKKDDTSAAAAKPPAPPAEPSPPDVAIDDEAVVAAVVAAARAKSPLGPELAKLPPRVSPMRVGVRVIHDHLLGVTGDGPAWEDLLAALGDLAKPERTDVDRGALATSVAAWRAWTPAQREVEHALCVRYTRALDLLRREGAVDLPALAVAAGRDVPTPPPSSAAGAALAAFRALHTAFATPGEDVPAELASAIGAARAAFTDIGWPAGAGRFLEAGAMRMPGGRATLRAHTILDAAFSAYRESGDDLSAALVTYDRVADAERAGDVKRAAVLAETAADQIAATGTRGRERSESLFRLAQIRLAAGDPAKSLAALDRALVEVEYAKLDPAQVAPIQEQRASVLWHLGRTKDAQVAAKAGADAYDRHVVKPDPVQERLRASLDEIRGRAAHDGGDFSDAADAYRAAAARLRALPGGATAAATDDLFAAAALARTAVREAAVVLTREVLAGAGVTDQTRAHAASVLRDAGAVAEGRKLLDDVLASASPELREALTEERARFAAAERRVDDARALFAEAARLASGAGEPYRTARLLLDWSAMETAEGDFESAARTADVALAKLDGTPYVAEASRAQRVWCDARRRAGGWRDAERVLAERATAGADVDAALGLALVRMEMAAHGGTDRQRQALDEAVRAVPSAQRLAAAAVAKIALGRDDVDWTSLGSVSVTSEREALLLHAVDRWDAPAPRLMELARSAPASEPEIRRAVLRRVLARPQSEIEATDFAEWFDLWAGAPPVTSKQLLDALGADGRFLAFQWTGATTVVYFARGGPGGGAGVVVEKGDMTFARLWEVVHQEPSMPAAVAATRAMHERTATAFRTLAAGPQDPVVLCVGTPPGPIPEELLRVTVESAGGEHAVASHGDTFVLSPSEYVAAAARPSPRAPGFLGSPLAPLSVRHAIVTLVPVDDAVRARFATHVSNALKQGLTTRAAVLDAKRRLREEWRPGGAGLPSWMAFALRGAE